MDLHTVSTCLLKFNEVSMCTPSSLSDSTFSKVISLTCNERLCFTLATLWDVPIRRHFDLFSLVTMQFSAHQFWTFTISAIRFSLIVCVEDAQSWSVASSAKRLSCECCICRGKSLIYNKKSMGPNTEPCGTPHVICCWEEWVLPILTLWYRSVKYEQKVYV